MSEEKKKINFGSRKDVDVTAVLDMTDPECFRILSDEEVKALPSPLPENLIEIKTKWRRTNYVLSQVINANSYIDKMVDGRMQRIADDGAYNQAQIRVLLKEWNLSEYDPRFELRFEKSADNPSINILGIETMQRLGELQPPHLLNYLLSKYTILDTIPVNFRMPPPQKTEEAGK